MAEKGKKTDEQGASTRTTPEDHVEIRISGTPEAVARMMEKGPWRKEGCEVVMEEMKKDAEEKAKVKLNTQDEEECGLDDVDDADDELEGS